MKNSRSIKSDSLRGACAGVALALTALASRPAAGASPDESVAKAKALFKQARKLVAYGRYDQACAKFEESLALDSGIGTEFNLADCWEHLGRTASAQALFNDVAKAAASSGQPERERAARTRAAALDDQIPHVIISAEDAVPALEIERDGKRIDAQALGTPLPIDPGMHQVTARSPGRKPWSAHVYIPASKSRIFVVVPSLEPESGTSAKSDAAAACSPKDHAAPKNMKRPRAVALHVVPAAPTTAASRPFFDRRTLSFALLGGGGAGAVVAGTAFALYKANNEKAKSICPASIGCSDAQISDHRDAVNTASTWRTVTYAGLAFSGVSLVGLAVVSTAFPQHREKTLSLAPVVGPGSWGAAMQGQF